MPITIYQSQAVVAFIQGDYIRDFQILVDNPEVFNILPGTLERPGIKTLSSSPIFVTVVLKIESSPIICPQKSEMAVREDSGEYSQIPFLDLTSPTPPAGLKAQKHKIDQTLSEIRKLHEELNGHLYSHPTERPVVHSPGEAADILKCFLSHLDHEELWVMVLDTRNRVKSLNLLYKGSVNSSQVRVGEVFRSAIAENSPAILIAHNHPSGDPTPSPEDVAVTRAIIQAGKLLDIAVLDHLVIAADKFVSLKERGLGFGG